MLYLESFGFEQVLDNHVHVFCLVALTDRFLEKLEQLVNPGRRWQQRQHLNKKTLKI
jgi:hypothetical protein